MKKTLFSFIIGITVATNMLGFSVMAEEALDSDVQTVDVEELHIEEGSDNSSEETIIDNESETASVNETINEGASFEEIGEEAGTEGTIEEDLTGEGDTEKVTDGERNEIEERQPEDSMADLTDTILDDPEDSATGVTDTILDDSEDSVIGVTEMISGDSEELPDPQTLANDSKVDEQPENVDVATPAMVYDRPIIKSISTDGASITLEWDNAEGALFEIYRWNILPFLVGTSTTGSFVDTDVVYGWSYTYFIVTTSSAYRYPYSQTVSERVRRPIEDIDEEHKIGEDLAWDLAEGEKKGNSLVISGKGRMPDFSSSLEIPWRERTKEIRHISIDNGVTYVGDHSFSDMEDLQEVSLPSSVREYGREVFRGSTNLEFFNHDSAVDGDQLHIAVQYLMGVYSGSTFEPEVNVRKGTDSEDFDEMPTLIQDKDYTVTYNNTVEAGDGTIEIAFIGELAEAGSVVIPFTVVSELREDEKVKNVSDIELSPSSGAYTGSAQHPDMIVRSGRWILKEGVDYILTYTDMIDVGTYTVTAQGIGAYSGNVQAVYTIEEQERSIVPQPPAPVNPSIPEQPQNSDAGDFTPQETVNKPDDFEFNRDKAVIEEGKTETIAKTETEVTETIAEPEKEEVTETVVKPEINLESILSDFENYFDNNLFGKESFSLGDSLGVKDNENVVFFVGAVGILASICIGVYLWFFHWFLHRM